MSVDERLLSEETGDRAEPMNAFYIRDLAAYVVSVPGL